MKAFIYYQNLKDSEVSLNKINTELEYLYLDSALTEAEADTLSEIHRVALIRNLKAQCEYLETELEIKLKKQL
jgi:hypothetical protein